MGRKRIVAGLPEGTNQISSLSTNTRITRLKVSVKTSTESGAGTDANVYFVVNGKSYLMDKPDYNDFERGDNDSYEFAVGMTLGELRRAVLEIGHDNKGRNSGWRCGTVSILVQPANQSNFYLYRTWPDIGWLASDENQGELWAILQSGEELRSLDTSRAQVESPASHPH